MQLRGNGRARKRVRVEAQGLPALPSEDWTSPVLAALILRAFVPGCAGVRFSKYMCVQVTFAPQGGGANAARRARVITPLYDVSSSCYADAQATLSQRPRPSQIRLRVGLRRRCWLNWQPTIARALRLGNRLRSKRHAIVISNRAVRWSERCGDACC